MEAKPLLLLTGEDGNEFYIVDKGVKTLRKSGATETHIAEFLRDISKTSTYEDFIQVLLTYFKLEEEEDGI